jgi:Flp pilus assembly protein TadG
MSGLLATLGRCRRGAAAVEFALVAPFMILLHLGVVESVQAWEAYRRASHVAATLADLTAQNRSVTSADLTDILRSGSLLIAPFPAANLGERIASITANAQGTAQLDWAVASNWTAGGAPSVPAGYLQPGESVVVADVSYQHQALFGLVLPHALTMKTHAYLRPRLSDKVAKM